MTYVHINAKHQTRKEIWNASEANSTQACTPIARRKEIVYTPGLEMSQNAKDVYFYSIGETNI